MTNIIDALRAKELEALIVAGKEEEPVMVRWAGPVDGCDDGVNERMTQWDLLVLLSKLPREDLLVLLGQVSEFPKLNDDTVPGLDSEQRGLREIMDVLLDAVSNELATPANAKLGWRDVQRLAHMVVGELKDCEACSAARSGCIDAEYGPSEEAAALRDPIDDSIVDEFKRVRLTREAVDELRLLRAHSEEQLKELTEAHKILRGADGSEHDTLLELAEKAATELESHRNARGREGLLQDQIEQLTKERDGWRAQARDNQAGEARARDELEAQNAELTRQLDESHALLRDMHSASAIENKQ